jgi:hypothetical protein
VRPQTAITLFGGFIGGKKSDLDRLTVKYIGNEWGHSHVAGVESQIDRLAASR